MRLLKLLKIVIDVVVISVFVVMFVNFTIIMITNMIIIIAPFSKLFYPETKKSRTKAENLPTQVGNQ